MGQAQRSRIRATHRVERDPNAVDRALVADAARGDARAFERLYRRHYRKILDFSARLSGRADLAEELANETFKAAWLGAARFENRSKVSTWLFGIAFRLAQKARAAQARAAPTIAYEEDAHAPASDGDDVEAALLRSQIARALTQLSEEHRTVVELTYYQGLHYSEIAEITACPVGTVKTRMMHARRRLRALLADPAAR